MSEAPTPSAPAPAIDSREHADAQEAVSYLLRLATSQADQKDFEAAIGSLKRAYTLMDEVATEWPIRTYFRVARYLHLSGRYGEAIAWLQGLLESVDARFDAREALNKKWGWMQRRNEPARISEVVRNNVKGVIEAEIALYARRQGAIAQNVKRSPKDSGPTY